MAIFNILLIFSAVSTFAFKSSPKIVDNALRNRFLSLSYLINSSNSSYTESEIDAKKPKTLSIPSSLCRYFL